MINIKKLNSFRTIETTRSSNIKISKNKSITKNKKVKFETPVQLNILTPNSISSQSKKYFSLNITDKKSKTKSKFFDKKIVIKSNENQKTDKKTKTRFNISPMIRTPKADNKSYVKYIKDYPKTFYQKIYNNLEKMKIKADKTIEVMKRNLSLTNHEVLLRKRNILNINTFINRGLKLKKSDSKNFFKENKISNHNSNNNTTTQTEKTNKIIRRNSDLKLESSLNEIKETKEAKETKESNSIDNQKRFSNIFNSKKYYLGLQKISLKPFYTIKAKPIYSPLYKNLENNKKFYKNMCHVRFGGMKNVNTNEVSKKIYDAPYILNIINAFIKEPDLQLKNILNKLRLLLSNIQFFYNNYLIKKEFRHAFINMENPVKAQLNSIIEEECILILKLVPMILKEFYYSLSQLLYIKIPELKEEMEKTPTNEIECLKYNIRFLSNIKEYLTGSMEIYRIIQKQIAEFRFSPNEFNALNNILDLARYNSTTLISMANSYIEKTKNDDDIYNNFKIGLHMKQKKYEKENGFERFHRRRKIKVLSDKDKLERIKSALNIGNKENNKNFKFNLNKKLDRDNPTSSILNSYLIKDMMKHFIPEIKEQIISQQVIERYKRIELERLKFNPDNWRLDDGSSNVNPEENEEEKEKKEKEKEKLKVENKKNDL